MTVSHQTVVECVQPHAVLVAKVASICLNVGSTILTFLLYWGSFATGLPSKYTVFRVAIGDRSSTSAQLSTLLSLNCSRDQHQWCTLASICLNRKYTVGGGRGRNSLTQNSSNLVKCDTLAILRMRLPAKSRVCKLT